MMYQHEGGKVFAPEGVVRANLFPVLVPELPLSVSLTRFAFFPGYYVNVYNGSTASINGVTITYTDVNRKTKDQSIGVVGPNETKQMDPSQVRWTVEAGETITLSAVGYRSVTAKVNSLIK